MKEEIKKIFGFTITLIGIALILAKPSPSITGMAVDGGAFSIARSIWFWFVGLGMILIGILLISNETLEQRLYGHIVRPKQIHGPNKPYFEVIKELMHHKLTTVDLPHYDSIKEGTVKRKPLELFTATTDKGDNSTFLYVESRRDADKLCELMVDGVPLYELPGLRTQYGGLGKFSQSIDLQELEKIAKERAIKYPSAPQVTPVRIGSARVQKDTNGGRTWEAYYYRDKADPGLGVPYDHNNLKTEYTNIHVLIKK